MWDGSSAIKFFVYFFLESYGEEFKIYNTWLFFILFNSQAEVDSAHENNDQTKMIS